MNPEFPIAQAAAPFPVPVSPSNNTEKSSIRHPKVSRYRRVSQVNTACHNASRVRRIREDEPSKAELMKWNARRNWKKKATD